MKMKLLVAVLLGSAISVQAADKPKMTPEQQAMMEQAMKYGMPGDAHKALEPFIGKWTSVVHFWMKPGDKMQESKGKNDNVWILGGRFVQATYKSDMNGQPFEGLGLTGYDNVRGEYVALWLDNMMTGMMQSAGTYDPASKTFKFSGDFSCPMTGEKKRWFRTELKVVDNDTHTYTSYSKTPDGKEFKEMEITYKRVKA
jgi:hypothetical protein